MIRRRASERILLLDLLLHKIGHVGQELRPGLFVLTQKDVGLPLVLNEPLVPGARPVQELPRATDVNALAGERAATSETLLSTLVELKLGGKGRLGGWRSFGPHLVRRAVEQEEGFVHRLKLLHEGDPVPLRQ